MTDGVSSDPIVALSAASMALMYVAKTAYEWFKGRGQREDSIAKLATALGEQLAKATQYHPVTCATKGDVDVAAGHTINQINETIGVFREHHTDVLATFGTATNRQTDVMKGFRKDAASNGEILTQIRDLLKDEARDRKLHEALVLKRLTYLKTQMERHFGKAKSNGKDPSP